MCGIVGVYGVPNASALVYEMLFQLQHRGQDGAGIVSTDGMQLYAKTGRGLLKDALKPEDLKRLPGNAAIGHVRYRTSGSLDDSQPIVRDTAYGHVAVAHNGNFPYANGYRKELLVFNKTLLSTHLDTEVAMHALFSSSNDYCGNPSTIAELVKYRQNTFKWMQGAYSMLIMSPTEFLALRDPLGMRPLYSGRITRGGKNGWVIASETCALQHLCADSVREIAPGEVCEIHPTSMVSKIFDKPNRAFCSFERIYLSRPDSQINEVDVSRTRYEFGRAVYRSNPVDADCVVPVLDSGQWVASGIARESNIEYVPALSRNHYIDRTFMKPDETERDMAAHRKYGVNANLIRDKRIILADDSIVRGLTMRKVVELLRANGAKEIHVRIGSPPVKNPCFFGVDMQTKAELYAANHSLDEMQTYIGADSLAFLSIESMLRILGDADERQHCTACFSGKYPMPVPNV